MTGDRNIGGHTARIPDHINFLSGDGPRGVGIDLSSKDKIETLAETIIPQTTVSKRSQLCMKLEDRWMYHHGGGRKATPTVPTRRGRSLRPSRNSQLDPVRSLFTKNNSFRPDAIQELIAQLRQAAATTNATNSLEQIAENPKPPGKRPMESRGEKKEDEESSSGEFSEERENDSTDTLAETEQTQSPTQPKEQAASPSRQSGGEISRQSKPIQQKSPTQRPNKSDSNPLPPHMRSKLLSKRKTSSAKKTVKPSSASTKTKKPTKKSSNEGQSPEGQKDSPQVQNKSSEGTGGGAGEGRGKSLWGALAHKSRQSTTPDSGFQSDSPSFTNLVSDAKSQGSSAPNMKLASAMTELLKSARMMQMLKKPRPSEGASDSGGSQQEQLISFLEEVGKEEEARQGLYKYNPKMKKVFQVSNIVSQLTGNRFIMPLTKNYELSDVPKDGQSFTRRRTRGLMYETLEPIVYSNMYLRKSPNLQTIGTKGRSVSVGGAFHGH